MNAVQDFPNFHNRFDLIRPPLCPLLTLSAARSGVQGVIPIPIPIPIHMGIGKKKKCDAGIRKSAANPVRMLGILR